MVPAMTQPRCRHSQPESIMMTGIKTSSSIFIFKKGFSSIGDYKPHSVRASMYHQSSTGSTILTPKQAATDTIKVVMAFSLFQPSTSRFPINFVTSAHFILYCTAKVSPPRFSYSVISTFSPSFSDSTLINSLSESGFLSEQPVNKSVAADTSASANMRNIFFILKLCFCINITLLSSLNNINFVMS